MLILVAGIFAVSIDSLTYQYLPSYTIGIVLVIGVALTILVYWSDNLVKTFKVAKVYLDHGYDHALEKRYVRSYTYYVYRYKGRKNTEMISIQISPSGKEYSEHELTANELKSVRRRFIDDAGGLQKKR
jgi:hypothetical protein